MFRSLVNVHWKKVRCLRGQSMWRVSRMLPFVMIQFHYMRACLLFARYVSLSLPPLISHSLFLHSFVFETHFTRTNVLLCCYDPRLCLAKQTASYFNAMFEFITWKIACNLRLVYRFRIPSSLRVAFELADWLTTKKKKATRKRVGRKMGELLSRVWESESVLCHFKCQPFCAYAYADI